jgi:hypothetical protein
LADSFGPEDLKQPVAVILCDKDPAVLDYMQQAWPSTWFLGVASGEYTYCGEKMNWAFEKFPKAKFYGHLCDDVWISTPGMLAQLAESAGDWNISFPADGIYDEQPPENLVCFPCMGGKLVRSIGWWAFPELKHNCIDSVITDIGRSLGLLVNRRDLRLGMLGPSERGQPANWDETYKRVETINLEAGNIFHTSWEKNEREKTLARIRAAMEAENGG